MNVIVAPKDTLDEKIAELNQTLESVMSGALEKAEADGQSYYYYCIPVLKYLHSQ